MKTMLLLSYCVRKAGALTRSNAGNIIASESDYGFVRRIRFQRMTN